MALTGSGQDSGPTALEGSRFQPAPRQARGSDGSAAVAGIQDSGSTTSKTDLLRSRPLASQTCERREGVGQAALPKKSGSGSVTRLFRVTTLMVELSAQATADFLDELLALAAGFHQEETGRKRGERSDGAGMEAPFARSIHESSNESSNCRASTRLRSSMRTGISRPERVLQERVVPQGAGARPA